MNKGRRSAGVLSVRRDEERTFSPKCAKFKSCRLDCPKTTIPVLIIRALEQKRQRIMIISAAYFGEACKPLDSCLRQCWPQQVRTV